MQIKELPFEILSKILEEVAEANIRDGPTYTFGLSQAPLPLQKSTLQRYVRGPVPPEMLKWDAITAIRTVCWQWHEWALEYALKNVYIRRWKGGEVSMTQSLRKHILTSIRDGQSCPTDDQATPCMSSLTVPPALLFTATPLLL